MAAPAEISVESVLADVDSQLAKLYPGNKVEGQPAHTVYVSAAKAEADLPEQWGSAALDAVKRHADALRGLDETDAVKLVKARLASQPVQDLRFDFEDGYGAHDDEAEDEHARRVGKIFQGWTEPGSPTMFGVRIKGLTTALHQRSRRTLELILDAAGGAPDGFVFTVPKVRVPVQALAARLLCEELEKAHGLAEGTLRFELQIESPQIVLGHDGAAALAEAMNLAGDRVSALHYGTYDYSAACGIAPSQQSLKHPVADYAKAVMLAAAAERGVWVSDGGSIVVPEGGPDEADWAVAEHFRLVTRSLDHGYYQGWDLHPAQLPTRWLATFGFYREAFAEAAPRLRAYLTDTAYRGKLDEPATAQQLAAVTLRGLSIGAITEKEVSSKTKFATADVLRSLYRRERPKK
ncbi:conserved hypothetical protein [Segniliparus rotundus DSM 44985]|uniref:Uncharacterized protein n=1 Tax=Segniliparus rotundus (strain ATCC BAA-972 / CDC 1076 / CIP 108378 / DSM 44985 / JCM 13578) TaxID=640132 RepID=D6Z9W5_SEGRD|nr:aldolase/citrate lyase family protein [Segniliparus rotundus]ADG98635.1 conserved hypothetical protein [Segniliparus rotundus DSM 44985]